MCSRAIFFLFIPLFFAFAGNAQNADKGVHRFAVRGDLNGVSAAQSDLFRNNMNGVLGGDLSLQYPVLNNLFVAVGGNLSVFESAEQSSNLLAHETTMNTYAPFMKVGVNPYLGRIFYVEASVKGAYRWLEFDAPICEQRGRKKVHGQSAFSLGSRIGFWWDAGDGMDFGAIVAREWTFDRFHPELICQELEEDHPKMDEYYGFWHFGFAFSADLVRP